MSSSVIALIVFFIIGLLAYLFFRSEKGFYHRLKRNLQQDKKTVTEDILKTLYHAENEGKKIGVVIIIQKFNYNKNYILQIIEKIQAEGLIISVNEIIELTDSGRDYALKIIRVHRLWEKYLSEQTGFDKLEWHDRAETMEHLLSEEEADSLATKLGNPRFDPHGDPIPTSEGELPEKTGKPLSAFKAGEIVRITHIEDEPEVIYKQILAEDLHIGSQLKIISSDEKKIKFYSEGEDYVLAPIVAANLTVVPLKKEDVSHINEIRLSNLQMGVNAIITGISPECKGETRRRLLDLGFVPGTQISINLPGPFGDPRAYSLRNTNIAIRKEQAKLILIEKEN
jgi:DtxR family Mn-dependent transcriptional regulator